MRGNVCRFKCIVRRLAGSIREFEGACGESAPGVSGIRFLDWQLAAAAGKSLPGYSQPVRAVVEFAGNDKEFAGGNSEFAGNNKEFCARNLPVITGNRGRCGIISSKAALVSPRGNFRENAKAKIGKENGGQKRLGYAAAFYQLIVGGGFSRHRYRANSRRRVSSWLARPLS
ncbi:MAG: hypothetical protein JWL90_3612 [Chthoniobacteraceae bacterium]|nr:hypothetical protein [Chthoniobacteraceae bacterium]